MKKILSCILVFFTMITIAVPFKIYAEEVNSDEVSETFPDIDVTAPETTENSDQSSDNSDSSIIPPDSESSLDGKFDTNTEAWGMIVTVIGVVLSIFTCVGIFVKKFGSVIALIKNKADSAQVASALKNASSEVIDAVQAKYDQITSQLKQSQENEKLLITVISIFMANVKINPSAKAEILKYLAGIKDCAGEAIDIVEEATAAIEKATAAAEEEAPATPVLDKIKEEAAQTSMMLG